MPQWPCRDRKYLISTSSGPYNHSPPVAPSTPLPTLGKKAGDFLPISSGRGKRPVAFWRPSEPRDVPSPICLRTLPGCPFLPFSFLSFSFPPPLQVCPKPEAIAYLQLHFTYRHPRKMPAHSLYTPVCLQFPYLYLHIICIAMCTRGLIL